MGTIKREVIDEAVKRINKRLKDVDMVLSATPLSDIITLRQEVYQKLAEMDITSPESMELVKKAAAKEKRLFALAKRQTNKTNDLITEKVKLENELCDLKNEIWRMDKSWINA